LLKENQSVRDVEAWILDLQEEGKKIVMERDNWKQELTLKQPSLTDIGGRTLKCSQGNLEEKVRDLERQLGTRAPEQADLTGDLEDTKPQLEIMRQSANEYGEQVTRILQLVEQRTGGEEYQQEREENGNEKPCFLGEDRKELRG
jgi:multidrug efflux pump subunit AcrB